MKSGKVKAHRTRRYLSFQCVLYISCETKRTTEVIVSSSWLHPFVPFCLFFPLTRAEWNSHLDITLWCFPTTKWHFILTFPLPVISTQWNKTRSNSAVRSTLPLLFKCFGFFFYIFSLWLHIRQLCQETVSINWTSLPCIEGIHFITWMRGHSWFLLSLWIDANEMEVTPALLQWFQQLSDLFFFLC